CACGTDSIAGRPCPERTSHAGREGSATKATNTLATKITKITKPFGFSFVSFVCFVATGFVIFVASIVADEAAGPSFDSEPNRSIIDDWMVFVPTLSSELIRQSTALARAVSAATRSWAMYPPEHPSVEASVARLADALATSTAGTAFRFAVTPETL